MPAADPWIKVRESLFTDPKVLSMASLLSKTASSYVLNDNARDLLGVTPTVTRDVMRDVTVTGLLRIWIAANRHTVDGTFRHADIEHLDTIAGIPGFGTAMISVGYAIHNPGTREISLPNFHEHNAPAKKNGTASERQRRWRARKKERDSETLRDSAETRHVTPTTAADKIRLEVSTTTPTTPTRSRGCTLAEAQSFASSHNILPMDGNQITPEIITAWHDDRSRIGWVQVRGDAEIPIRDWQADLRAYARHWTQNSRSQALSASSRQHRNATPPPPPIKLTTEAKKGF